ncbi:hypothetical protein B0H34DRAFT_736153 [Crassisporium funariophilum]|nr:hypothetical protein B0H34DRAFT_736153 [Crassisporium funariophilum]
MHQTCQERILKVGWLIIFATRPIIMSRALSRSLAIRKLSTSAIQQNTLLGLTPTFLLQRRGYIPGLRRYQISKTHLHFHLHLLGGMTRCLASQTSRTARTQIMNTKIKATKSLPQNQLPLLLVLHLLLLLLHQYLTQLGAMIWIQFDFLP